LSSGCCRTAATTWSPNAPASCAACTCCYLTCAPAAPTESSPLFGRCPVASDHPITAADIQRKRIARELLADVRRLDRQIKTASQTIRTAVREHGTTLTQVFGVGPVLAAKLLGHTGDITRFPDRDHFASYTGTALLRPPAGMCAAIG